MATPRYLTKSRFKLALECSTKLFYTRKAEYPDKKLDNDFLQALARGGFQVGELAKCYFPGGIEVTDLDYEAALAQTNRLLEREEVIIFEAAFRCQNLFIRADIVRKTGSTLLLYEVKAKSFDPGVDSFSAKREGLSSKWKPYLYDVAFQKYVIGQAFPEYQVKAYLMLCDKSVTPGVEGLNQRFFIYKNAEGRTQVEISGDVSLEKLGRPILTAFPVDEVIDPLFADQPFPDNPDRSFVNWIHHYADHYQSDRLLQAPLKGGCKNCEFQATEQEEAAGLRSGFKECWKRVYQFSEMHFRKPSVLDLWDFRKKDAYIRDGRFFQEQLNRADLEGQKPTQSTKPGLTRVDRQELQLLKSTSGDNTPYFDAEGLAQVFEQLTWPLHFIDFETTAVAVPFQADRRPYEQTAFQFSHHIMYENGEIEHKGQWINTEPGQFPNFVFVRQLKRELEADQGSIFRYAAHENSILCAIRSQLLQSVEPDRDDLCQWIETISHSTKESCEEWQGARDMIDLRELVLKFYYAPETKGSNSIKQVLPAVLNNSEFLQQKYSKPIYGGSVRSLNFQSQVWVKYNESGKVINPYDHLEPIFQDVDQELLDTLTLGEDAELRDGGAAMTAYAQMQFTRMRPAERELIRASLLKYCELDTLAMVMIWEDWRYRIVSRKV